MEYSEKARVFLTAHGMEPESVDLEGAVSSFLTDIHLGLAGRNSSLRMIPTYLTADGQLPLDRPVAVIDAGGTNFRTALVTFTVDGPVIEHFEVTRMPGADAPVSWEEFISVTAQRLLPLLEYTDTVGFCFSYPTEETPQRDGRLITLTKQVIITGFEGRLICADLREALAKRGGKTDRIVLLNDTPAVLLSGASLLSERSCDGLVGLISGTGTNTCCSIPDEYIRKPHGSFCGNMLVNLESGAFSGLPRGDFDRELDNSTVDPGTYRHEKMTSGAYCGELCRLTLRGGASEGLFSDAGAKTILSLGSLATPDADGIASGSCGKSLFSDKEDLALASQLCRAVFDRAARCVCSNLAAILTLTDCGGNRERPACICADGSLFTKSRAFRPALERYMSEFTTGLLGRHYTFRTTDNATMLGSAAAALLN